MNDTDTASYLQGFLYWKFQESQGQYVHVELLLEPLDVQDHVMERWPAKSSVLSG